MSPLSSFKRLSVGSTKSTKSGNSSVLVNNHPSPLDVTFALNIQSSPAPLSPSGSFHNNGGYAEMLEDENMSWGSGKGFNSRSKRSKRGILQLF